MLIKIKFKDGSLSIFRYGSYDYIHFYKGECNYKHNLWKYSFVCINKDLVKSIKYR